MDYTLYTRISLALICDCSLKEWAHFKKKDMMSMEEANSTQNMHRKLLKAGNMQKI